MADTQSNAPLGSSAGTPATGVIHVRTRLTADFTVIANDLAQRTGSAVVVGVAAYIASLPDGTPITIEALCRHFDEGEILISRALRDLEDDGYLERRRVRQANGRVRTHTYFYDVPGGIEPDDPPEPPTPPRPRTRKATRAAAATAAAAAKSGGDAALSAVAAPVTAAPPPSEQQPPAPAPAPEQLVALADIDPQVLAVLTSLRRVDPRLVLSLREAARLAPAIGQWLAAGVGRAHIVSMLTEGLPDHFLGRPVGILAYRLRETPLPLPPSPERTSSEETVRHRTVMHPLRNCDGCDRGFRAPESVERCGDCRSGEPPLPAAC